MIFSKIIRGEFLTNKGSLKTWKFLFFIVVLMLLMIASSHSSDQKVMKIARLNAEVKELRAQFLDTRSAAMSLKLESTIKRKVADMEIKTPVTPPHIIKVTVKK